MKKMISIQLDIDIILRLKQCAEREGISVSAYVRRLILNDLRIYDEKDSLK